MAAGRFPASQVQPLALEALKDEAWEAKQGGLAAAAEAVKAWDSAEFRAEVLDEARTSKTYII